MILPTCIRYTNSVNIPQTLHPNIEFELNQRNKQNMIKENKKKEDYPKRNKTEI